MTAHGMFGMVWLLGLLLPAVQSPGRQTRFDFETGDLQGWKVMAGRFGAVVSSRDQARNTPGAPYPKRGRFYLSTTELADGGYDDGMTGVIESPVVLMTGDRVAFWIGGGGHPDTRVALCTMDDAEVMEARGANSEQMRHVEWRVPHLKGKRVYLRIEDHNKGGFGHITMDDVELDGQVDENATVTHRLRYPDRVKAREARLRREEELRERQRAEHRRQLTDMKRLAARGKSRVYAGAALRAIAIPMGGIGTGCIQMSGDGSLANWQIFGNHRAVALPNSFLAIRCAADGLRTVQRRLQGRSLRPTDDEGYPCMASVRFRGEYPFGWWTFADPALPVTVELEAFSPLIPGNANDSAIPCVVFRVTAVNTGKQPVRVTFVAVQQNAVGCNAELPIEGDRSEAYGGNINEHIIEPALAIVRMSRDGQPQMGTMALCALGSGCHAETPKASPTPQGETLSSSLASDAELAPGQRRTQEFVLAWHFPSAVHGGDIPGWTTRGYMYENRYADAEAVVRDVARRLPNLLEGTRLYHDTLYESNLPVWLLDRISSQVAVLRSPTVFWGKDGYLGGWEGCSPAKGCCAGNCSHVWHYAQAHARLWPEIGRIMREQELRWMKEDGAVPHRQPDSHPAFDGQCGTILGAYREHLLSPNAEWLRQHWPRIRAAMDYLIRRWDADEDGILAGPQWNTLDENLGGNSSWMGSLYIAALMACERMAAVMNAPDIAERYRRTWRAGSERQDAALFNGRYYIQIPEATPYRDYGSGCHIDQVLGDWWSRMLDMDRVYPESHVRSAMAALYESNFRFDFIGIPQAPRKFVHDEDAGMQMITWPQGGRPEPEHQMLYADEVMTGFEYAAASTMIYAGLLQQGLTVARAISDRYDGRLREGLTASDFSSWGYSGNPFGDDECGKFYARAMSSWALLLACQGLVYDGPAGTLGFRPRWKPEDHRSFFSSAEAFGLFTQKRARHIQHERIEVRQGRVRLRTLIFQIPDGMRVSEAKVTAAGNVLACTTTEQGTDVRVELPSDVSITAGQAVEASLLLTKR